MKVFISNIDTPLGWNLSRILSTTLVGSRQPDDQEEEDEEAHKKAAAQTPYTIIGTISSTEVGAALPFMETGNKKRDQARRDAIERHPVPGTAPRWATRVSIDDPGFKDELLSCRVVCLDLSSTRQATAITTLLAESATELSDQKILVGISSLMTWAKTALENTEAEALAEDEYKRRKPHVNSKDILALEKEIVKLGKKQSLKTWIVAPGIVYHAGESMLHHYLKTAWENESPLTCYGDGTNVLPMISLDDLVNITVELIETTPEQKYIVAVDDSKHTLGEVLKAIADNLGTGIVKHQPQENVFLQRDISQENADMATLDLKIDAGHVKEMTFEWKYEAGIVENMPQIVQEYKDCRGLWPLKIMIHGPPASRKTHYAEKIASHYKIKLVDADQVMKDTIDKLERKLAQKSDAEDADAEELESARETLNELKETLQSGQKFTSEQLTRHVHEKLKSTSCRNQGYILDGFPATTQDATALFKPSDDEKDDKLTYDEQIIPEFVFSIEASDAFIKQRIMKLPEAQVQNTRNAEEQLVQRLDEYRKINTDETTVLNYFDELEINPITLALETAEAGAFDLVLKTIGRTRNYGASAETVAAEKAAIEKKRIEEEAQNAALRSQREQEELDRSAKAQQEYEQRLTLLQKQEQVVLQTQSLPLRSYLLKHVIPTLTAGLVQVAKSRPDDPIDFLAEYLFRQNPGNAVELDNE